MNNLPIVSILSPVYNGAEYIEDCIKSVLKQTYRNYEYIILDNASTDDTPIIIDKFRNNDSRIKAYRNDKTVGMEENFNLCAGYSSNYSKWLKYALADDYLFPDCVEKMVEIGEEDAQIGIVSAYRMAGNIVTNTGLPINQNIFDGAEILKKQILRTLHVASSSPNSVMYNRKVFFELSGFNKIYDHSDTELAFRILNKYKLGFVHHLLTRSGRDRGGGEYNSIMRGNKIKEYLEFGYKNIKNYNSISIDDEEIKYLKDYYSHEIAAFIVSKIAGFNFKDIKLLTYNTPIEIKKEVKKLFLKNPIFFLKKYIKVLFA